MFFYKEYWSRVFEEGKKLRKMMLRAKNFAFYRLKFFIYVVFMSQVLTDLFV